MASRQTKRWTRRSAILLAAVASVPVAGFCVAKMISTGNNISSDAVGVAKWDVSLSSTATGDEAELGLVAGGAAMQYPITVTNASDVASDYKITVSGVPEGVKVALDAEGDFKEANNGEVVFDGDDLTINVGGGAKNHILRFAADLDAEALSGSDNITVKVDFIQKEPI